MTLFNNPLSSFHEQVAEAKEEREQNSLLLVVSTPHEKLILVAVVIIGLVMAAWLAFGSVNQSLSLKNVVLHSMGSTDSNDQDIARYQTLLPLRQDVAEKINTGTKVEFVPMIFNDLETRALEGEVIEIMPLDADLKSSGSTTFFVVDLSLPVALMREGMMGQALEGRLAIGLGYQTPAALLGLR